MLAHDFHKHSGKIKFPCLVQPKLDGVRCFITRTGLDTFEYMSRNGKPITTMSHLGRHLTHIPIGVTLDGELYIHDKDVSFQTLVSWIKKEQPGTLKVEYHIYDVVNDMDMRDRLVYRKSLGTNAFLKQVDTIEVVSMADIGRLHQFFTKMNTRGNHYEGVMVRNLNSLYKDGRSFDLLKYKEFDDAEFTIVGGHSGTGKTKGQVIFECQAEERVFNVVPSATAEDRVVMLKELDKYIGQKMTVKYQGKSDDGVPRFPIGIGFRFEEE